MSKIIIASGFLLVLFSLGHVMQAQAIETAHTPAKGSAERQAILDAMRQEQKIIYKVHYLKVHGGWAWIDVTPQDEQGKPTAEGGPSLLHLENGQWVVKDLASVPEDPNDPLGAEDASVGFVKNLRKTFPGVPSDIFPKPGH